MKSDAIFDGSNGWIWYTLIFYPFFVIRRFLVNYMPFVLHFFTKRFSKEQKYNSSVTFKNIRAEVFFYLHCSRTVSIVHQTNFGMNKEKLTRKGLKSASVTISPEVECSSPVKESVSLVSYVLRFEIYFDKIPSTPELTRPKFPFEVVRN